MHELRTSLFASLVPHNCDECRLPKGSCESPRGLNGDGKLTRGDDPACVVSWPSCPGRFFRLRRHGQDALPLSEIVAGVHDRGDHRLPDAPAGLVRIVTEWSRQRKLPRTLMRNRATKDAEEKRKRR